MSPERPPLHPGNKVYTLTPQFVTNFRNWLRKAKIRLYKKRKINKSKTPHKRFYHMKFQIQLKDEVNTQLHGETYEMVVPARAVFFAKLLLEKSIKNKISVDVIDWEEISDEEHTAYMESQEAYYAEKLQEAEATFFKNIKPKD